MFVLAAVVTATLSLDATVVLLTPVVLAAGMARSVPDEPGTYACLRMANSASLLLPVSNLTNLLALPHLDLTFTGFAVRMAPVLAVVLVVEYVGLRLLFRDRLAVPPTAATPAATRCRCSRWSVVVLMLVGFAVVSPVRGRAVVGLAGRGGRARGCGRAAAAWSGRSTLLHAAHPGFAIWVLALGVVVAGLAQGFLGDAVRDVVPASTGLGAPPADRAAGDRCSPTC